MTTFESQPMDVTAVLQAHKDKQLSIEVDKDPLHYDLGHLAAFDSAPLDLKLMKENPGEYLKDLARDNMQLLVNQIWTLPVERREDAYVCELPAPTTNLPREKPVPGPKHETKWEKFAKTKGIVKTKKSRMVFNEDKQDYVPRWGYGRADDDTKDWIKVMPDNPEQDQYEDLYGTAIAAKKERINKNKRQQQANLAAHGLAPKRSVVETQEKKKGVEKLLVETKTSTASLGRFDKVLKNEPKTKVAGKGKKRNFEPVTVAKTQRGEEKAKVMRLMEKVLSKDAVVMNTTKAANQELPGEQKRAMVSKQGRKRRSKN